MRHPNVAFIMISILLISMMLATVQGINAPTFQPSNAPVTRNPTPWPTFRPTVTPVTAGPTLPPAITTAPTNSPETLSPTEP